MESARNALANWLGNHTVAERLEYGGWFHQRLLSVLLFLVHGREKF